MDIEISGLHPVEFPVKNIVKKDPLDKKMPKSDATVKNPCLIKKTI